MSQYTFTIGVDPDLHHTSVALYCPEVQQVLWVGVAKADRPLKGMEAVVGSIKALQCLYDSVRECPANDLFEVGPITSFPCSALVVEGQQIYSGRSPARPNDLLKLAQVAGGAVSALYSQFYPEKIFIPTPRAWKGNVPKALHQERLCRALGWRSKRTQGYSYPLESSLPAHLQGLLRASQWKHALDAVGLALWGATKVARRFGPGRT